MNPKKYSKSFLLITFIVLFSGGATVFWKHSSLLKKRGVVQELVDVVKNKNTIIEVHSGSAIMGAVTFSIPEIDHHLHNIHVNGAEHELSTHLQSILNQNIHSRVKINALYALREVSEYSGTNEAQLAFLANKFINDSDIRVRRIASSILKTIDKNDSPL
ncbi:MAG: hypothetical protein ACKVT0_15650 [Planctomycetaceae bacterium]